MRLAQEEVLNGLGLSVAELLGVGENAYGDRDAGVSALDKVGGGAHEVGARRGLKLDRVLAHAEQGGGVEAQVEAGVLLMDDAFK